MAETTFMVLYMYNFITNLNYMFKASVKNSLQLYFFLLFEILKGYGCKFFI